MSDDTLTEELQKAGAEPLLPVEKKLIAGSLITGLLLLLVLGLLARLGGP